MQRSQCRRDPTIDLIGKGTTLSWYFDYYRIGKRRQWIGAPVPICVNFRSDEPYNPSLEKQSPPPRPRLIIDSGEKRFEGEEYLKNERFRFRSTEAAWVAQLDTTKISPGTHDVTFRLDANESITAADQPLVILTPSDYRSELVEEAEERFLESRPIWSIDQLGEFMKREINRKLADRHCDGVDWSIHDSPETFRLPIASAPISWVLDALATEYGFLLIAEPNPAAGWYFAIEKDVLMMGFEILGPSGISKETKAAVENREFGDLHLLNAGNDFRKFAVETYFSHKRSRIKVEFSMHEGSMRGAPDTPPRPIPPPPPAAPNTQKALRYRAAGG